MASSQSHCIEKSKPKNPIDYEKTPLWRHVEVIGGNDDGGGNRAWVCNYCGHGWSASYSRVRGHLLALKNVGIAPCSKITPEILDQLKREENIAQLTAMKKKEAAKQRANYMTLPESSDLVKPRKKRGIASPLERAFNLQERDELDKEFARMMYSAAIPFNFTRNPFLRSFCYKLSTFNVPGYRPPSYNRLRTTLLAQEATHVEKLLQPMKDQWVKKGVSICSDGWSDRSNKPIVNIMAACGTTAMFLDSFDASGIRKDAPYIADIFFKAIDEVGASNIVQVVTDNGGNFKAAGSLIEQKFPSIFWTPCVVHCLNLAFKSICEPSERSAHYEQCKWLISLCDEINEIQKFVTNHDMVKGVFNKHSKHQLLQVADTRFASYYIVAERLTKVKSALDNMVIDPEWRVLFRSTSNNPVDVKVRKIRMLILDDTWWEKVEYFLEFTKPIYTMIRDGDKDSPVLHRVYDMWDTMIEKIKVVVFRKEKKNLDVDSSDFFDAIHNVLVERWDKSNTPLHCLAHSLVPKYYSVNWLSDSGTVFPRISPHQDPEVSTQRNICFQRLFPNQENYRQVLKEYGSFSSGLDFFSQTHVIASRDVEEPISWWANYGSAAPLLQTLAFRLLSQPASSSCCERNWSLYDNIKTVKRNRLTSSRAKDLVRVHNNIRLLSRQEESYKNGPCKYWDIGGDNFDVDAEIFELAELTINDPEFERLVQSLGDDDADEVGILNS
ncbi:hypothetical protein vseg_003416 [Gypsophila vaccaria]